MWNCWQMDYKQPNTEVCEGKWGQCWWSGRIPLLLRNAVYIWCLMLCFRIDFKTTHDGALSRVLILPHLWRCLCSAGTRHIELPCFKGDTCCCFCTPRPSSFALGEREASPGAAQLAWRCGVFCCKAEGVSKYNLLWTKQRSVECFGTAEMGMKFLIYLPQAQWLRL